MSALLVLLLTAAAPVSEASSPLSADAQPTVASHAVAAPPVHAPSAAAAHAVAAPAAPTLPADAPRAAEPRSNWRVPVLHSAGLLVGMRVALSAAWPRAYDPSRLREGMRSLRTAYTRAPEFHRGVPLLESDGDPWALNTLGHGLFGSEVYGRTRQCGHGPLASLAAAAVASTVWEYGPEALHQRPSALDLVWTPLAGALLGEGRYQLGRLVRGSGAAPGLPRRVLLFVIDPLGETERRVLGTGC